MGGALVLAWRDLPTDGSFYSAIADLEKIEAKEDDIKKMIDTAPDEETRKKLESPEQQIYIKQLLRKRTVIDNLSRLV